MVVEFSIAVIAPSYPPAFKAGGPARTLEALVAEAPLDLRVMVFAPDRDLGESSQLPVPSNRWSDQKHPKVFYFSSNQLGKVWKAFMAIRQERPNAIYVNSFFNPIFAILPLTLKRVGFFRGAQILLAPRGELDSGAVAIKPSKKRRYLALFKGMSIHHGVIWHASSPLERAAIVAIFGEKARVVVRENETKLPLVSIPHVRSSRAFVSLVFLSRISRKKGLDTVLRALKGVTAEVRLDVFGPREDEKFLAECMDIIAELPSNIEVGMKGPLEPSRVRETLSTYDAMVLPSHGENFGHVIAEALSASCPVICSDRTPWSDVLQHGGGVVVDSPDDASWSRAFQDFAAMSDSDRVGAHLAAGHAFETWRRADKGRHVFDLLRTEIDYA